MNHRELAKEIINYLGGPSNISQSWHCITRLRFNIVDDQKVDKAKIDTLDGVIGSQFQGGQYQIIIGSEVMNVFAEISSALEGQVASGEQQNKGNIISQIFDVISGIFTPILAAITGSGLLKGILALLVVFNVLTIEDSTYIILDSIASATFYYLPFLIAFSAAKKFKTNASISVALAGILMSPTLLSLSGAGDVTQLKFMGLLTIPMNDYNSSVIPIILTIWLLSYVEKYAKKFVPNSLTIIFVPLICLLVTAPIMLAFIAPLGMLMGTYLEMFFSMLFNIAGPLAGALMGGLMPLIVITGMHYAFFPGTLASLGNLGYDVMLLPMNLVANLSQAGATLGVVVKTKDKKMKQLAISSFIPAVFGITEPAIYGVTMKLKKPFYASMIGGAVGGAIFGTFAVKTFSFAVPGILAVPTYIESGTNNLLLACIGILSSFAVGFIMTLVLSFEEEPEEAKTDKDQPVPHDITKDSSPILAPITGTVLNLSDCPDQTFSSEMVGKGLGIVPTEGTVVAPFDGVVTMTTGTNHAIGLLSDAGVEMLIHIGIDTVELGGDGFQRVVNQGDRVTLGDVLLTFDIETITKAGLSLYSPVVITNTLAYLDVVPLKKSDDQVVRRVDEIVVVIK